MQPLGRIKKRFPGKQDDIKHDDEHENWWENGISNDGCKKTSRRQGKQSIQRQLVEMEEDKEQQRLDDYEEDMRYGSYFDYGMDEFEEIYKDEFFFEDYE